MDREKVIKGLQIERECVARDCDRNCAVCDLVQDRDWLLSVYDSALVLLKEQEPILLENQHKPYGISTNSNSPWISRCSRCDKKVECKQTRFCKYCGQAVKWNE